MKKIVSVLLVLAVLSFSIFAQGGQEAAYPTRNINLVVPYNAGGTTDLTARALANGMAASLGVQINITNTPGASGATGTMSVLNAPVDGYTLLGHGMLAFTTMPVTSNVTTKTYKDWDIWLATFSPNAICVSKDSPYNTIEDLVADIKARPGQITFGTGGVGSGGHFGTQVLSAIAGSEVKHTPYNGGSAAVTALLSKEIDVCPQLLAELKDLIISGDVKCLAVLAEDDIELAPGVVVPSILKSYPDAPYIPMGEVTGIMIPKGLDEASLQKLDAAFENAVKDQGFIDLCETKSFVINPMGRAESQAYLDSFASNACYILWDAEVAVNDPAEFGFTR